MTDGYSSRELRRRSLSYSGWYIDVYLYYVRHGGKMLLRAAVGVQTRIQAATAAVRVYSPDRHRSPISYDKTSFIDILQLYRWRVENAISGWKKRSFVLIKRLSGALKENPQSSLIDKNPFMNQWICEWRLLINLERFSRVTCSLSFQNYHVFSRLNFFWRKFFERPRKFVFYRFFFNFSISILNLYNQTSESSIKAYIKLNEKYTVFSHFCREKSHLRNITCGQKKIAMFPTYPIYSVHFEVPLMKSSKENKSADIYNINCMQEIAYSPAGKNECGSQFYEETS